MVKSFSLRDNEATNIITSIADDLKVTPDIVGLDFCLELPEKLGHGYFRAVKFSHGLSVLEANVSMKTDFELSFEEIDTNPLVILFNMADQITIESTKYNKENKIAKLHCTIFSTGTLNHHTLGFSKNQMNNFFALIIDRKSFETKMDIISNELPDIFRKVFKDVNGVNSFEHSSYFSLEIAQFIEEFRHCALDSFMKPMFLEGKAYEILTFQLQHFNNKDDDDSPKKLLRRSTIDKIEAAVDVIDTELDVTINVHALAKRVGLNQTTLQSGFKNLFQTSVNDYIKNKRLDRAKILMETSDLNITEITYKIGINSRSYFSKLFKDKFGIAPSAYMTQYRAANSKTA